MENLEAGVCGELVAICVRPGKGIPKAPQCQAELIADFGVEGDRHAGSCGRQVSLLALEVIKDLAVNGFPVSPGVLGENLTVVGLDLGRLHAGDRIEAGCEVVLEVTEPRTPCKTLTSVDPRLPAAIVGRAGVLCRVIRGGILRPGDRVEVRGR